MVFFGIVVVVLVQIFIIYVLYFGVQFYVFGYLLCCVNVKQGVVVWCFVGGVYCVLLVGIVGCYVEGLVVQWFLVECVVGGMEWQCLQWFVVVIVQIVIIVVGVVYCQFLFIVKWDFYFCFYFFDVGFVDVEIVEDWYVFVVDGFLVDKVWVVWCFVGVGSVQNVDYVVDIILEGGDVVFDIFKLVFFFVVVEIEFEVFVGFWFQIWVIDDVV